MSFITRLFGDENSKTLRSLQSTVDKINALESEVSALSDEELRGKTTEFRARIEKGEHVDMLVPEAFAVVREASKRVLGQRHYDVQLIGGLSLHQGKIAEMRTGEGKTLVGTLPVYANALVGRGVHVVTVNDYLSRRDAVWMGQIYSFLGLTVGVINHEASFLYDPERTEGDEERDELGGFHVVDEFLRPCSRAEAYQADITYGTNNEFGFDHLRDNLAYRKEDLVQREYHFAVVDEIDSILIDEARTPLIISAPANESEDLYTTFAQVARSLTPEEDYTIDEKLKAISLTNSGITKAENLLGVENIYTEKGIKYVHHLETAVRAKAIFERDKDYVVRDDEVVIVDEFTGRMQPGRRWSEGLHQAIEAKEGVKIQKESRTAASITFQNYFRMYEKLAGMTGTAKTSSEEFYKVYKLEVVSIPTNRPVQRIDHTDLIYQTEKGKFQAIVRKVKELHEKGQPVLVGTASIEKNELLSAYFTKEGIPHEVLNAKNHEREGEIIAQAGAFGRVTIATNMAGRGVDIKLGGNPGSDEEYEKVKAAGGLFVIGTERHEARRIDNQLRGRAGRQGDPGETQFYVSLEDTLMRVFASDMIKRVMGTFGIPEDEPIQNKMISRKLESAQTQIEGFNFDARRHVLQYDDVLNQQRDTVYGRRKKLLLGDREFVKEFLNELIDGEEEYLRLVEEKKNTLGEDEFYGAVQRLLLQMSDLMWMDHLEAMDYLRSSVRLRAYGQRDPLVEYKKEGLRMFHDMQAEYRERVLTLLPNIGAGVFTRSEEEARKVQQKFQEIGGAQGSASSTSGGASVRTDEGDKIGRNDRVKITNGKETREMKYKKAEPLIRSGEWRIV